MKSVESTTTNRSTVAAPSQQPYKKSGVAPKKPPNLTANDFPSLSTTPDQNNVAAAASQQPYPKIATAPKKKLPNLSSNNFPTYFQTSSQPKTTFLQSQQSSMSPEEQLSAIKTILGPTHYKKLKSYTKQFALAEITPHYYIDESAKLFSQEIKDPDFWTFMPILLNSCPDENNKVERAMQYLASLWTTLEREEGELRVAAATTTGGNGNYAAARQYYAKQQKQQQVVAPPARAGSGGSKKLAATATWGGSLSVNKMTAKNKNNTASKNSVMTAAM
jgi:hypothetical protein